jgi:hypothetical protein
MRFVLERTYEEKGTRGELFDEEGNHVCLMIERPKDRRPSLHPRRHLHPQSLQQPQTRTQYLAVRRRTR